MTDETDQGRPTDAEIPDGVTLRITLESSEEFHDRVAEKLDALEDGVEPGEHVRAFATAAQVRRLLTDKRIELVEELLAGDAESITALAEHVDRATSDVHDDLHVLADEGIVRFERDGRRVRPTIPYDAVRIDITLTRESDASGTGEARA